MSSSPLRSTPAPALVGLAITVGMMVNLPSLLGSTFSLFLKPVSGEFGWGRQEMSLAVLIAQVVTTPLYPLVGRLADRFGPRVVVLPGMVLFGLCAMALSLIGQPPAQFIALYLLASLAGTLVSGVVFGRGVAATFSSGRGKALGICLGLGGGLGAALSPILASGLIEGFGWRQAYVALGVLPIVIGLPVLFFLFRLKPADPSGAAATSQAAPDSLQPDMALGAVLRDRSLWIVAAVIFFSCLANNGVLVHLAALLTDKGVTNTLAAELVSAVALATCFGQIFAGFLLDRFETPRVGLIFAGSMLAGLLLLQHGTSPALSAAGIVLFGFGIGSEYSLIPYYLSRYFGVGSFGLLYGLIYAASSVAGGIGPYLMGLAFDTQHSYALALTGLEAGLALALIGILVLPAYRFATLRAAAKAAGSATFDKEYSMAKKSLRQVMEETDRCIVAPCVYDCASARAVEMVGFPAMMLSGGEVSIAMNGVIDYGFSNLTDIEWITSRISQTTAIPLAADIEDGFGGPLAVYRSTKRMIAAGATALQLEDTGDMENATSLLPREKYYEKVRAALAAMEGSDCILIARTNADPVTEMDEGCERMRMAVELGARMSTVVRIHSMDHARYVAGKVPGWKMFPDVHDVNGKPAVTAEEIYPLGFNFLTMHYTLKAAMDGMLEHGIHNFAQQGCHYTCQKQDATRIMGPSATPLFDPHSYMELESRFSGERKDFTIVGYAVEDFPEGFVRSKIDDRL